MTRSNKPNAHGNVYRVSRKCNKSLFVETENYSFALSMIKEEKRNGYEMELRQKKGNRWYKMAIPV